MAALTRVDCNEGAQGLAAGQAACGAGGDSVDNDGRTVLVAFNGDSAPHSVTVTPSKASTKQDGLGTLTKAALTTAVAAGDTAIIGPFPPAMYNDVNGKLAITYTAVTSMKIMAVRVVKV